jgi:hypothetical protein
MEEAFRPECKSQLRKGNSISVAVRCSLVTIACSLIALVAKPLAVWLVVIFSAPLDAPNANKSLTLDAMRGV